MSVMTSFKRKRIEKWCEDVAQYLHDGTICKSVIGNVAEDAICGSAYSGPIRIGTSGDNISENILDNFALINNRKNTGLSISTKNLNAKVDLAFKKAAQTLVPSDGANLVGTDGVANADGSVNIGGSFPVVKFAYSHYHEQRRKIDRLVQGLPVLNANGVVSAERPSSKSSTEDHVPIIIVNGEEPVRSSQTRSRSSSQPRRIDTITRYSNRSGGLTASPNSNYLQQIQSPATARRNMDTPARPANNLLRSSSGNKLNDSRPQANNTTTVIADPGINLTTNDRVSRIKTAPVPNRNLHRARQRILSRRGNRVLEHTSQIPLQNCWALAELTW